ncbi:dimethylsulfonioproprionate lyase family protein [Nocardioides aurantiacus]|uniref:dimethylsulfonioproprionate lyase family protein n=1 Tax=Nocardioides aurantiacus TaxID=86796 RepID=UPI003CCC561C
MVVERTGTADDIVTVASFVRDQLLAAGFATQAQALEGLDVQSVARTEPVAGLPVLSHLQDAVELARQVLPESVGRALACSAGNATWTQTEAYLREPPSPTFVAGYAHATLAGPPDLASETVEKQPAVDVLTRGVPVALGLLLLAPGLRYPHHQHPADELYVPLSRAKWSHGQTEPFDEQPVGVPLHHRPGQAHAMATGQTPLLAMYVWTGAVTVSASWCRSTPPVGPQS